MKALQIAVKDTLTRFRDWKALAGMLAAPLLISGLIGLAFGNLTSQETPIQDIPVALVNHDEGELGQIYAEVLGSAELDELIELDVMDDLDAAKARIESGELRAVVYIPAEFSAAVIPDENGQNSQAAVQLFTDPASEVSPVIIGSIVERISAGINTVVLSGQVAGASVAEYAQLLGPQMAQLGPAISEELNRDSFDSANPRLGLEIVRTGQAEDAFDPFAFFIPGMAVFFLMFSMFEGSRSILQEERHWTLQRMMSTPTSATQLILGKMGGTFLTGILQFTVLVLASMLLFQVSWGHAPLALALIAVLTVFAASGLGALLTVFARNENQAGVVGSAVSLIFGALGGSFFPAQNLSGIVNVASKLTINRWAMDGFLALTVGRGGLPDVLTQAGVLAAIGAVTFVLAIVAFHRRFVK